MVYKKIPTVIPDGAEKKSEKTRSPIYGKGLYKGGAIYEKSAQQKYCTHTANRSCTDSGRPAIPRSACCILKPEYEASRHGFCQSTQGRSKVMKEVAK